MAIGCSLIRLQLLARADAGKLPLFAEGYLSRVNGTRIPLVSRNH